MINSVANIECSICLDAIKFDKKGHPQHVTKLACDPSHIFHKTCFDTFKKESSASSLKNKTPYACPLCRADIVKVKDPTFMQKVADRVKNSSAYQKIRDTRENTSSEHTHQIASFNH